MRAILQARQNLLAALAPFRGATFIVLEENSGSTSAVRRRRHPAASTNILTVLAVILPLFATSLLAQNFSSIPPLAFTKSFGGANPLPQILTVTATDGSVINF